MRHKRLKRIARHKKIRKVIFGTGKVPRLSVFRSNKHIYAQLIDDQTQKTIAASSDLYLSSPQKKTAASKMTPIAKAYEAGTKLAKIAIGQKIKNVVFDRGGYKYHGKIKALAEGARKEGLIF